MAVHPLTRKCVGVLVTAGMVYGAGPAATVRAAGGSPARVVAAWNESTPGVGKVRGLTSEAPWLFEAPALDVGEETTVRVAGGLVYAVSRTSGTITVIDPVTWTRLYEHAVDPGCKPEDIAVVMRQLAYVSCAEAVHLLRFNPETGVAVDAVDLSGFADADGLPEMSKMALHEGRLFVQVRRFDWGTYTFAAPAMIVVIDVATEQLIDVDPLTEGVQAIELHGTGPKFKMQIVPETRRMFVSATGAAFDAGGLEMIDLDSLQSLGLIVREADGMVGADLGAFVLVTPERGYLTFTTDLALSSHLVPFTVSGGVETTSAIFETVGYFVPTLAFDPRADTLFFPDGATPPFGIYVFDAATGELLTTEPIVTDGQPTDLAIFPVIEMIPATSSWGLIILALLLLSLGSAAAVRQSVRSVKQTSLVRAYRAG